MRWYALALVFLVLVAPAVVGAPPQSQTVTGDKVLEVVVPEHTNYLKGTNISFHVHLYNATGIQVTPLQASCYVHVYAPDGGHLHELVMENDNDIEFEAHIDNTTYSGQYPYIVWCNTSDSGGFTATSFEVSEDGRMADLAYATPIAIIVVALLAFMLVLTVVTDQSNIWMRVAKLFFILISFWLSIAMMAIAKSIAVTHNAPAHILRMLDLMLIIDTWVTRIFTMFVMLYFVWEILLAMGLVRSKGVRI